MHERWAQEFGRMARDYWTPERVQQLTSGKELAVTPDEAPELLRALGLLHRDASMPTQQVRKYRQINHMVGVLRPALRELAHRFDTVHIVDAGCGRSYLTILLAHYFARRLKHPARILGVDRMEHVIEESRRRARMAGLSDTLRYHAGDLARVVGTDVMPQRVDMLVALHACDTATDEAIAIGVRSRAEFIAVAPCCQADLSARWSAAARTNPSHAMAPIWSSNHLRRATAADVTDSMRLQLLRAAGYDTTAIEFVPSEHTPKNTLIRAVRRRDYDAEAWRAYEELKQATGGVGIALEALLAPVFGVPA